MVGRGSSPGGWSLCREIALFGAIISGACDRLPTGEIGPSPDPEEHRVEVISRIKDLKTYPCVSLCHFEIEPKPLPRELTEFHIGRKLEHGSTLTSCRWCHQHEDYDRLTLINGTRVSFDEAFRLCGQCHATKLRDWNVGVHGRQTGSWSGLKRRASCPACHDPHRPTPLTLKAMPAPAKPGRGPGGMSHALE